MAKNYVFFQGGRLFNPSLSLCFPHAIHHSWRSCTHGEGRLVQYRRHTDGHEKYMKSTSKAQNIKSELPTEEAPQLLFSSEGAHECLIQYRVVNPRWCCAMADRAYLRWNLVHSRAGSTTRTTPKYSKEIHTTPKNTAACVICSSVVRAGKPALLLEVIYF